MIPDEVSPADVLAQILIIKGFGNDSTLSGDWPVYVSMSPDEQDQRLCVYDTAGVQEGREMRTGEMAEFFGAMISVRAKDHPTGWGKAQSIAKFLDKGLYRMVVPTPGGTLFVQSAKRTSPVLRLGQEKGHKRMLFSINLLLTLKGC